jgi:hypothetical protein
MPFLCFINQDNNFTTYVEKSVGPNSTEEVCAGFHGIHSTTTEEQQVSLTGVQLSVFAQILSFLEECSRDNHRIDFYYFL